MCLYIYTYNNSWDDIFKNYVYSNALYMLGFRMFFCLGAYFPLHKIKMT